MRILGIDPGLNHTGWGVVDDVSGSLSHVASGVIDPPKGELSERLACIARGIEAVVNAHSPDLAACERAFVNMNPQSTLMLGQARGAAITAAALAGLSVMEFTPSEIKEAVTGSGRADKLMVQRMMDRLLTHGRDLRPDEADALACAVCCAHRRRLAALERSGGTVRTYATARRGRTAAGARSAWTALLGRKGFHK
jgi:crossover junction endodeoxyribonuclease RuvC